jgi:hypothetical protein
MVLLSTNLAASKFRFQPGLRQSEALGTAAKTLGTPLFSEAESGRVPSFRGQSRVSGPLRSPCPLRLSPCRKARTGEPGREPTRESTRAPTTAPGTESGREPTREPTREPGRESTRGSTRESGREPGREPTRGPTRESGRASTRGSTRAPGTAPTRAHPPEWSKSGDVPENQLVRREIGAKAIILGSIIGSIALLAGPLAQVSSE